VNLSFDAAIPIVGILRGFSTEQVRAIVNACLRGELRNLEITMGSPHTPEQIRLARDIAAERMSIGAGTVLNVELLEKALDAGATFIVTPIVNVAVIRECVRRKIPVFPGAYTPTEILNAWELGATMVKVFPAETLGPGYIKAIKAPLPQVKLMPTGGVDLKTIGEYKKAGADGFGVGSPLFDRARVEAGDWAWVEAQCRAFVEAYSSRV
jgi:2-dehydro-3-deoxyphosphogluconate aldolase / (4S)-4-hydroxy-2-oxoglutarate aldolase